MKELGMPKKRPGLIQIELSDRRSLLSNATVIDKVSNSLFLTRTGPGYHTGLEAYCLILSISFHVCSLRAIHV